MQLPPFEYHRPASLDEALATLGSAGNSLAVLGGGTDLLPQWGGAVVMVAYILVLAVAGRFTTFRRDIG